MEPSKTSQTRCERHHNTFTPSLQNEIYAGSTIMASRKAKNPKASTAMCPVCEKAVIDGGRKSQDSIFCEGSCQAWLHRCCAELTRTRFAELSDDSRPFYCPSCASDKHTHELAELKSAVASLVPEVEQLKSTVVAGMGDPPF